MLGIILMTANISFADDISPMLTARNINKDIQQTSQQTVNNNNDNENINLDNSDLILD